jgi:hypothetical protein
MMGVGVHKVGAILMPVMLDWLWRPEQILVIVEMGDIRLIILLYYIVLLIILIILNM